MAFSLQSLHPSHWSIRRKLTIAMVVVAIVPMGFIAYYNLQESLQNAENSEYRKLELLATSNASRLDQFIIDLQRVVVQVSTERNIVQFLSTTNAAKTSTLQAAAQRSIDNVFRSNPDYDAVYLLNSEGRCLVATDPTFVGQHYAFREYFQVAIQGKSFVSSILPGATSKRRGVYLSNPVRTDNGKIVGVAVLKIRGEEIATIVTSVREGSQTSAFLVDERGIIISHSNQSFIYRSIAPLPPAQLQQIKSEKLYGVKQIESLNLPQLAAAMTNVQEPGHASYYSVQDQMQQMVGFAPLRDQDWVLGVSKPKAQFTAPLNRLIWQSTIAGLGMAGIAAIAAIAVARSIAQPIRALTKAAKALEDDYFDPSTLAQIYHSQDDIGQLVRVFQGMAECVKSRELKLKQQVIDLNVEIDEARRSREVSEITGSDYFRQLEQKARKLKRRRNQMGESDVDYFQQLQRRAQHLKKRDNRAV